MTDFAAVFALGDEGWVAADADLTEVVTIEDIADLMREAAVEVSGDTSLLLVAGGPWFAVVRITGEADPRVFLSDSRAGTEPDTDRIAALLYAHTGESAESGVSGESTGTNEEGVVGDVDLLRDLGADVAALIDLSERGDGRYALAKLVERVGMQDAYAQLG